MRIAVLALQGAFIEHERMLASLGADVIELRQERDLQNAFDGLVLPGGESTVQGKLLRETGLFEPLRRRIESGLPVFGTCAGLLLLARRIDNDDRTHFAVMDVAAVRNAYGRQLGSFSATADFDGVGRVPAVFIRAPYIARTFRRRPHRRRKAGQYAGHGVPPRAEWRHVRAPLFSGADRRARKPALNADKAEHFALPCLFRIALF